MECNELFVNSYVQEREAIETRLKDRFDTNEVPVQFSNLNFLIKGTETIPTPYKGPVWIRLNVVGGISERTEITQTFNQVFGEIKASIFVRTDIGSNIGRKVADRLYEIYNTRSFNGITTDAASLIELPPNNGWYQLNFTVPYRWQRCLETTCSDK